PRRGADATRGLGSAPGYVEGIEVSRLVAPQAANRGPPPSRKRDRGYERADRYSPRAPDPWAAHIPPPAMRWPRSCIRRLRAVARSRDSRALDDGGGRRSRALASAEQR